MDREMRGFSLIELLVVVAIMTIILLIGIPLFLNWKKKYDIENDAKTVYAFLQNARAKAFTEKIKLDVVISGNQLCMKCDDNDNDCKRTYGDSNITCVQLRYSFEGNTVNVSRRGTFSGGPVYYPSGNEAQYDCVRVSDIRIRLDKCNGSP